MSGGGFLNGLVRGVSAGAIGYGEGKQQAQKRDLSLASLLLQREQQQRMTDARVNADNARAEKDRRAPAPKLEDKLHDRVQELVSQGKTLDEATKQAREEYGQSTPQDPVATHKKIRDYDVTHPTRAQATTQKLAPAVRAAQALAGSDATAVTRAQTQLDTDFPIAPSREAYSKHPTDFPADSTRYADGKKNVDRLRARADSTNSRAHELTTELVTQATGGDDADPAPSRPVAGAGSASSSSSSSSATFTPKLLKQHQLIDKNATDAINQGADPAKVAARANQLHAQLEQSAGAATTPQP